MLKTNKNRRLITALLLLTVLLIAFILCNSAQTGEESAKASGFFSDIIKKFLGLFGITPNEESLSLIVRKSAHFCEYFALGALTVSLALSVRAIGNYAFLSPAVAFAVAVFDEFVIQKATEGRSPAWTDVLIDVCGAVTAAIIALIILKSKNKKECNE